jgi:hypothetical protein
MDGSKKNYNPLTVCLQNENGMSAHYAGDSTVTPLVDVSNTHTIPFTRIQLEVYSFQ